MSGVLYDCRSYYSGFTGKRIMDEGLRDMDKILLPGPEELIELLKQLRIA